MFSALMSAKAGVDVVEQLRRFDSQIWDQTHFSQYHLKMQLYDALFI